MDAIQFIVIFNEAVYVVLSTIKRNFIAWQLGKQEQNPGLSIILV